ncbi:hypothetical protein LXL04_034172 [Taraxacum kok-saghyz]
MVILHEISEISSSSSTHLRRYDVFLSFRGLDTRNSFTAYLYKALVDANITTFLDDEEIETGEDLKPELESAIKASRVSVIVLSKNYAASTWCLDELVLILEQRKTSNQFVVPIFYHVEPTHVRKQENSFKDAMTKHRKKMEDETDMNKKNQWAHKMDKWEKALVEVSSLKGKDANGRLEMELIDEIVMDIFRRLHISSRFPLPELIGMDDSIKFVTSWLKGASSHTANILTILGVGGMGKTSLAKYVYVLHSHEFETKTFIEDINRRCVEKSNGLLDVQKELCDNISKRNSVEVHHVSIYTSMIETIVAGKRVFLVFDDIDSLDQLDALLGRKGFHPGSKIIITTKNASLTQSCTLFKTNFKPTHTEHVLKSLSKTDSQNILCFHAFMSSDPKVGYEEVSEKLVKYCDGHPMALQILGRSLHNRDVTYWEGHIDKLMKENDSPINSVLKLSFDSLSSENDKELFKHIACFFVGMDKDVTISILEACDIETRSGIANLIDRCLVSVRWNKTLMVIEFIMHQLVQEMGRFMVRKESLYKPWERSRLWGPESFRVLKQKKGTENVLGLTLDTRMLEKENGSFELKTDALSNMDNLMLLQLNYVKINGSYDNFPKELRWLCMHGFPLKSLPSDLLMENLVALDMSYSNIESFGIYYSYPQRLYKTLQHWTGLCLGLCLKDKILLIALKILNLSFCGQLPRVGGFDRLPKLERLILRGCVGLLEVCESIGQCSELVYIDFRYCNKLEKLPRSIGMLTKVKTLLVDGCNLGESRVINSTENLKDNNKGKNMEMSSSSVVKTIPSDLKFFTIPLPKSLVRLSLINNNLSTESFPMDFSWLFMLKELYLDFNPIEAMPSCVRTLPRIERLSLVACNKLTSVEDPPLTLNFLQIYIDSDKPMLRRVLFNPQIRVIINWNPLASSSFEYGGLIKIQPIAVVEENILHALGWTELDFLIGRRLVVHRFHRREESEIQVYYEFGIFSTIYEEEEMPNWITDRSTEPSIVFTIPSSPNNLTGLNFCCVLTSPCLDESLGLVDDFILILPVIIVTNITKNLSWIYKHYIERVNVTRKFLTLLSHWKFGMNEMEAGDNVTILVVDSLDDTVGNAVTKECGVSFVYDNGEEDALNYYKSWKYIIGKDLTRLQLTTGLYYLNINQVMQPDAECALQNFNIFPSGGQV